MSDALRLDGIGKTYNPGRPNALTVLTSVSLSVVEGEVVALVAPSGAGKSTLLHIAGLLDSPDTGSVSIAGDDFTRASDRARTEARRDRVGFVYQFHHLLPEFSAAENVILPQLANAVSPGKAETKARDLLERVGLAERASHRPAQLVRRRAAAGGVLPGTGQFSPGASRG